MSKTEKNKKPAKKPATKPKAKAASKKATAPKAAKKVTAKKAPAKAVKKTAVKTAKPAAKKPAAKKATVKKPATKPAAKKSAVKTTKPAAKKAAVKTAKAAKPKTAKTKVAPKTKAVKPAAKPAPKAVKKIPDVKTKAQQTEPAQPKELTIDEIKTSLPGYSVMRESLNDVERLPDGLLRLNLGPSHPATHGILQNIMDVDGETIVRSRPVVGYVHRTFEKLGEKYTYNQFLTCTDRMNYISPPMNNLAWITAVEEMTNIKAPPRAQVVRTIINELSRIADHIICNGILGVDLGAYTGFLYLYHYREMVYNILEKLVGSRLTTTFSRIGGLEMDIYPDFVKDVKEFLKKYPKILKDFNTLLVHNRIFMDRARGVGAITPEDALAWGYTGPNLRAAGVPRDLRKDSPYFVYDQVDFDIPVGTDGSVYDRFLVRQEEMVQSVKIIEQLVDNIPEGPFAVEDYHVTMPPKQEVYKDMEQLIYHFKLVMHGIKVAPGEYYSAAEVANGELGFYIVADGSEKPYRVHVRRPCFWYYQSYPELVEGGLISDAIAVMSSLNVIAGELDG